MKRIPSFKSGTAVCINKSNSEKHRREFSAWLSLSLILLTSLHLVSGSFIYGQNSDDAVFIDKDGNVTIEKELKAEKFEGEGSAHTLEGVETLLLTRKRGQADCWYLTAAREPTPESKISGQPETQYYQQMVKGNPEHTEKRTVIRLALQKGV